MTSTHDSSTSPDRFSTLDFTKIKAELESNGKVNCPTPNCSETFKSIWGLKFHFKKNSCNAPKFKCDKCTGAFQSRILLLQHVCNDQKGNSTDKELVNEVDNDKSSDLKSDNKMDAPPNKTNAKFEAPESAANSLGKLSPQNKRSKPTKEDDDLQIISKDNPSKNSSTLQGDGLVEKEEIFITAVVTVQTPKPAANSPENVTSTKRKRGRTPKSGVCTQTANNSKSNNVESPFQDESKSAIKNDSATSGQTKARSSEQDLASPKRKRGRPRRTKSPEDNASEERLQNNSSEINKNSNTGGTKSAQDEDVNDNKSSVKNKLKEAGSATLQDVTTPRKKRGRPPKGQTPKESANSGDSSVQQNGMTSAKKRGRPRKNTSDDGTRRISARSASKKVNYAENEQSSDSDDDDASDGDDDDDDDGPSKKTKLDSSNEEDDDDGDDDGVKTKTPKSKKKKKENEMTEQQKLMASLRKQLKTGKIACANKCGKKFSSIAGYNFHLEICGKERSIIKCEMCGKEYTTQAGLKYHLNAFHAENEDEAEEKKDEVTKEDTEWTDDQADASRRPRRAASRAKQKFLEIQKEQKNIEAPQKSTYGSRSAILDQHVKKVREDIITPVLMKTIKDQLKENKETFCPNKECQRPFTTFMTLKTHYLQCGFESPPYLCLLCGLGYNSVDGVRWHVEKFHGIGVDGSSKKDSDASDPEPEDSVDGRDSDVDYKKGTDEESSDDEEDDVDYEVIDEGESEGADSDSGDDDGGKNALQWDKHKKRYKVEMRTKANRKGDIMLYVGRWNKTFRQFENWRKVTFSKNEFFTEHFPTLDHWSRVQSSDVSGYIPTSTQSPHFRIVRPNIPQQTNTLDTQLSTFTGLPKDDSGVHGDRIFYTGGPVWELSWCPTPDGERNANQYLIASAHNSFDEVHNTYEYHKGKGLLQVWNLGTLSNILSSSGDSPTLALAIAHDFGPVWRISWCPNGMWQSPSVPHNKNKSLSRLGLMALACGDGIVRVISVPHPDELLARLGESSDVDSNETEESSSVNKVMVHCVPHMELYPCPINSTYNAKRGQALCVDWSGVEPFDKIAAGFSDGTITVWNLLSESPLVRKDTGNKQSTLRLAPIRFIKAHLSVIRDLAFCPGNVDFLASGGHDRSYKIWDLKSPISPVFVAKKGFPYEIEWPFYTSGFLYCEDVLYFRDEPSVRLFNLTEMKPSPRAFIRFPSSTFTLSFNSWINVLASADVGGNVVFSKLISSGRDVWHLYKTSLEDLDSRSETPRPTDDADSSVLKEKSRSLKEETNTSRIVFEDKNTLQFQFLVSKKNKDLEEKLNPVHLNCSTLQAVHKVRWNPNKQALTWIATGGASGLVRIHHMRQVEPHHLKSAS